MTKCAENTLHGNLIIKTHTIKVQNCQDSKGLIWVRKITFRNLSPVGYSMTSLHFVDLKGRLRFESV